jgi:membrane protein DedA with SNARE-associated domain
MFEGLTDWVTQVVATLGYVGVALLVALENVFPPIPSEVVLPLAGFVAGRGDASLVGMLAAATGGSVVGAWVLYGISAAVGPQRLREFIARHARWLRVGQDDLTRAERWFDRRSDLAVLTGRCVPLIRSLVSVPAGFRRMPLLRFTAFTAAGSLVWNLALLGAGALLGGNWRRVGEAMDVLQAVLVAGAVAGVAWWSWTTWLQPRWRRRDLATETADEP